MFITSVVSCHTNIKMSKGAESSVHEFESTNDLFRRAVEVYLRRNREKNFEKFQLEYNSNAEKIVISSWNYSDVDKPTREALEALLRPAKKHHARRVKHHRRREKHKKRLEIPVDVYTQVGTSVTGKRGSDWTNVAMCEKGETDSSTITIETAGFYRISLSGKCFTSAGALRVLQTPSKLLVLSKTKTHRIGDINSECSYSDFIDVDLPADATLVVQQMGTAKVIITLTIESIIPESSTVI